MSEKSTNMIQTLMVVAKGILHTKDLRRKMGMQLCILLLIVFSVGVFVIGGWLNSSVIPFVIYWGGCFLLCILLILLALYDAAASYQEVTKEHKKEMSKDLREIAGLLKKAEEEKDEKG